MVLSSFRLLSLSYTGGGGGGGGTVFSCIHTLPAVLSEVLSQVIAICEANQIQVSVIICAT